MTNNQTSHTEFKNNVRLAKQIWPGISLARATLERLRCLTAEFSFSVSNGDLLLLGSGWYVTHAGLLRLATRSGCFQITAEMITEFCKPDEHRWVFRAFVQKRSDGCSFSGFGDADPSNVQHSLHGSELRIAETRAVNRALRKAYGIGICSVEELANTDQMAALSKFPASSANGNGSQASPRVRDQLCALIRKHRLDADLVKRYAADFCGTETLRNASRDLVQDFVKRLSEEAEGDKSALLCRLNSYSGREVKVS